MLISIRYNFRNPPEWARPSDDLYNRVLDQIEWADQAGFDRVALAEHHFLDEAFLPSLLPVAAAIAGRTKQMLIGTEIFLLTLHHPVRVAEDAAIVDIISRGRFALSVGAGYREEEFAGMGMERRQRVGRMEEGLQILRKCWTEEEFSFDGKYYQLNNVRMMPKPVQPGGPQLILGAGSVPAAKRAARLADDMMPTDFSLWDVFYDECEKLGRPRERKPYPDDQPAFVHVTEDPDRDWEIIRPHAVYEVKQYEAWGMFNASTYGDLQMSDETLRAIHAVWTPEQMLERVLSWQRNFPHCIFSFAPILAGMDPVMAESSLELIAHKVLPALHAAR